MKFIKAVILVGLFAILSIAAPFWNSIPSLRAGILLNDLGQVESVTSLMTAENTNTSMTDITFPYFTQILGGTNLSQLQYGLSLISYESWMTDTFSFNVTMVSCNYTAATIRFNVLENTFFTQAKVHYMVLWLASTDNANNGYYNMEVIYGCTTQNI